jgi:hypothetical protein
MNLLDFATGKKNVRDYTKTTEWYTLDKALEVANQFDSVQYNIVYSEEKPRNIHSWDWTQNKMIKVGCSSGKGFGMADDSMSDKHRTNRRKGTTQPKDRLSDHYVIMRDGPKANQIKKNIGNLAAAWGPVFEKYGWGPKLIRNVWVQFIVPSTNMNFVDSSMYCEFLEVANISNHKSNFGGSAPLADLKYQSETDREMRGLLKDKAKECQKRITRISNDDDYLDKKTNNNRNFNTFDQDNSVLDELSTKELGSNTIDPNYGVYKTL